MLVETLRILLTSRNYYQTVFTDEKIKIDT